MDYLHEVDKRLDLPRAEKAQVMAELEAHWTEVFDELSASGLGPAEAAREAEQRLGAPLDIAARLNAVHNTASWRSALITIAPILGAILVFDCLKLGWSKSLALTVTVYLAAAVLTAIIIAKTYCEIKAGRRPVWLATWLAASIVCGHWLLRGLALGVCRDILGKDFSPLGIYVGSHAAIVVVLALLTSWDSPRWRTAAAFGSALMVSYALATVILRLPGGTWGERALSEFGMIVYFALWIAIALRVFAHHRYGCSLQASLFLYVYFAMGWQLSTFSEGWSWLYWVYPQTLAAAIVVLICVRSHSWWRKTAALLGGVIAIGVYPLYDCLFVWKGAVLAGTNVSTVPFFAVSLSLNLLLFVAAVTLPLIMTGQDSHPRAQIVG